MSDRESARLWVRVRDEARGQWHAILFDLAPTLHDALDRGPRRHVFCPVHTGKNGDAFRLFDNYNDTGGGVCNTCGRFGSGPKLLAWANNWSSAETLRELARWLRISDSDDYAIAPRPRAPIVPESKPEPPNEKARQRLKEAWRTAVPANDASAAPLRRYFENRGLPLKEHPECMRFHPSMSYYDRALKRVTGYHPTILTLMFNAAGKPVNIHRTYITNDGRKADVPKPKKEMQSVMKLETVGGAIHLFAAGPVLAITEGIETGYAVHLAANIPVWPCANAVLLENVIVPPEVTYTLIFADRDKPQKNKMWPRGEEAARRLMERLTKEGRFARTYLPPARPDGEGVDWLDVWNEKGKAGFPTIHLPDEQELRLLLGQAAA